MFAIALSNSVFANENKGSTNTEQHKFDPGPFIMNHIGDSYEWHIATLGHTHLSIPLPIILYSEQTGFHFFISSKFHHGKSEYKNFAIATKGNYTGKIIEKINGSEVRPWDFSITKNVLALFFSLGLLLFIFRTFANKYRKRGLEAPSGFRNAFEVLILFIRNDVARPSIGDKKSEKFMPFLLTLFFFILINNLLGLFPILPGGANVTGNIAVTLVLALFTFGITTINGNKNYWRHMINPPGVPWWLKFPFPLMPIVEIMGMFIKPFVLMVRLFANITAGHIIALGFFSLIFIFGEVNVYAGFGVSIISVAFTIFMTVLEFLVAFIQAYVFTLLTALYFGMATEENH